MPLFLVCGYKEHGKDYFSNLLINNKVVDIETLQLHYKIYYKDDESLEKFIRMLSSISNYEIFQNAFANKLKDEICELLSIDRNLIDSLKSSILTLPYEFKIKIPNGREITYRDVLIDHGLYMRSLDPDYWIDACIDKLKLDQFSIISDVRFINEIDHKSYTCETCLIRIHRNQIPVAEIDDSSEHSLDTTTPDILLLDISNDRLDCEYLSSCGKMKQY